MAAVQATENHGDDIIHGDDINHGDDSGSTEVKGIVPWNISQMITNTVPISTRIVS